MLGILMGFTILGLVVYSIPHIFSKETYGSRLEEYIVGNNPRDIADVERLTREYDNKTKEGYL
jgi:hypothetical protein